MKNLGRPMDKSYNKFYSRSTTFLVDANTINIIQRTINLLQDLNFIILTGVDNPQENRWPENRLGINF